MSLGIIELLTRIGEDHVRVQNIEHGDVDVTTTKHGTRLTFYADPAFISPTSVLNDTSPMVGLVVWMPRALVDAARAAPSTVGLAGDATTPDDPKAKRT